MSNEKKNTPKIGGINMRTFGGDRKKSPSPDSQQSEEQNNQLSSNLDNQMVKYPEGEKTQLPDSQSTKNQDKQMVSYLREKKPERKAQIAYLPPALIKRLKRYALDHEREISEVVADAVEQFLDSQERRQD